MNVHGFSFVYPMLMSLLYLPVRFTIVVTMLFAAVGARSYAACSGKASLRYRHARPLQRHGLKKPYLIFGMCDENFSINYTAEIPPDVDEGWFMFFVTLLNHIY